MLFKFDQNEFYGVLDQALVLHCNRLRFQSEKWKYKIKGVCRHFNKLKRQAETERQTDRQTQQDEGEGRQAGRKEGRQADIQQREAHRHTDGRTNGRTDRLKIFKQRTSLLHCDAMHHVDIFHRWRICHQWQYLLDSRSLECQQIWSGKKQKTRKLSNWSAFYYFIIRAASKFFFKILKCNQSLSFNFL